MTQKVPHQVYRILADSYLDIQKTRIGCQHRLRHFDLEIEQAREISKFLARRFGDLETHEHLILKQARELEPNHPIWEFCDKVKGLGDMAAVMFLGFINPVECTSAGKAKAFWGIVPGAKLEKGKKSIGNPELRARMWIITRNVIMAKDPVYSALYNAKKQYYLEKRGFQKFIDDPKQCPDYAVCIQKLARAAQRQKRTIKSPPCKAHVDSMAKRWLAGIILSHAWELIRKHWGLPINPHRGYIPPAHMIDPESDEFRDLCERIRNGIVE